MQFSDKFYEDFICGKIKDKEASKLDDFILESENIKVEAEKFYTLGDYAKALSHFHKCLELVPDNSAAYFKLAQISIINEDVDQVYGDEEFKRFFAPEFRNRLDGVVTFGKLDKPIMMKIVGKFLLELKNQVTDKSVTIDITDPALDYLVDKGFDPKMGARPLHRIIDQKIKNPLSKKILFGELRNGGHLTIDVIDPKGRADDNMILSVRERVQEEVPT